MTEEPGKRWRHAIYYRTYYSNIYNFNDLYKPINHVKTILKP